MSKETFGQNNEVSLIGTYGSDLTHALSAWTSTSRDLDKKDKNGKTKRERIPALLTMLAENSHHTPFEKSSLHFLVTSDIASHIHIIKHRINVSVNSESARYKELKQDKLYLPVDWPQDEKEKYVQHMEAAYENYHRSMNDLTDHYMKTYKLTKRDARKRAKESARFYLPYGNQITCDVMFNFRSFYHFISLRYSVHAQKEIAELAEKMLKLVIDSGDFPETLKAFGLVDEHGQMVKPFE